jgi:hypothetical protein
MKLSVGKQSEAAFGSGFNHFRGLKAAQDWLLTFSS